MILAQPSSTLEQIVQKEALYCVIGRCAIRLKNVIPFEQWVSQNLVTEARSTDPKFVACIFPIYSTTYIEYI